MFMWDSVYIRMRIREEIYFDFFTGVVSPR